MDTADPRIVLVDTLEHSREMLAARLSMQGYRVEVAADAIAGAHIALLNPPAAIVADLWMPGISGVQLCRLIKAEPATEAVPVVLCGPAGQKDRFWAERAGASEYVTKGRMGDLLRALNRVIKTSVPDSFFVDLQSGGIDMRDRIASHLDAALFDSVLAAEVRALGASGNFDRLFDLLSQFVSQIENYRWLSVVTLSPVRLGLHTNPKIKALALEEASALFGLDNDVRKTVVEDGDAYADEEGPAPVVASIILGKDLLGRIACACVSSEQPVNQRTLNVIATELGGPLRISLLVEESQRMAAIDSLTGLMNRRAATPLLEQEIARGDRYRRSFSVLLLDIDHFKSVNDSRGHAAGDAVISSVGKLLREHLRKADFAARWGGEEFLIALPETDGPSAKIVAERIRLAVEALVVHDNQHEEIRTTISIGVSCWQAGESASSLVDRADRAMYAAKTSGRNRVALTEAIDALESEKHPKSTAA